MSGFPDRQALQPERTALAWQRTAITSVVILVPLIIVDVRRGAWALAVVGSVGASAAAVLISRVRRRFHQLHDDDVGYSPFHHVVRVAIVCSFVAAGGVCTAALTLLR